MAKVSMIQRELKRQKLIKKYSKKRAELKTIIYKLDATDDEKWQAQIKLQKFPLNSSPSRSRSRCDITGRPRGVYRKFRLCRNVLRKHAMLGHIPGLKKASW